ncbi:hypothetical protein IG631_04663 [Alternaria alternata]|nr:hypothetical protein IG631_04663 [Alternaria alternata]
MAVVISSTGRPRRDRLHYHGPIQRSKKHDWLTASPLRGRANARLGLSKAQASCSGRKKQATSSDGARVIARPVPHI